MSTRTAKQSFIKGYSQGIKVGGTIGTILQTIGSSPDKARSMGGEDFLRFMRDIKATPPDVRNLVFGFLDFVYHRSLITATAFMKVRRLNGLQVLGLLAKALDQHLTQNDLTAFINNMFDPEWRKMAAAGNKTIRRTKDYNPLYAIGEAASAASLNGTVNNVRPNEYKIVLKNRVNSHVVPARMLTVGKILRHFGFQLDPKSIRLTSGAGGASEIYFVMSIA